MERDAKREPTFSCLLSLVTHHAHFAAYPILAAETCLGSRMNLWFAGSRELDLHTSSRFQGLALRVLDRYRLACNIQLDIYHEVRAVIAAFAAIAVSQVSGNATLVHEYDAFGATDQGALRSCLDNYRIDNWDGMDCGGRGCFKGSHNYKSPRDCYDACAGLLVQAINRGASDVECDDYEGSARYWMGFH
ncbi:hypothetical protein BN946_scf184493.g16 [Trametes cinnabarina]|uniref:Uncharacterized protein n=1 Tax=Pycnoporus cinnabarinus TaxID=5643 RepID=A0A060STC7_PYCCI|nr:hypothetical protein BN946_scf184493.g16 [Trametes cinnabarina]